MTAHAAYPVQVQASLDSPLSRWLWLIKWAAAIPHFIVLAFLWVAMLVTSVAAFFAILFTGRYPRSLFEFNVGVLRWTWRVQYYTYGALATDRYPPFTLADVPDYPARLVVDYPERLSRGLVLVKWWLLAIPHYLIVGLFLGGGTWAAGKLGMNGYSWPGGGLIGLLALVAAIALAVTGSYPRPIFDFILGLDRWVLRVAAYAALMTDAYPPFRIDMGGSEPGGTLTVTPPASAAPSTGPTGATLPDPGDVRAPQEFSGDTGRRTGWTGGRIASLVAGSLVAIVSLAFLAAGGALAWLGGTQRGNDGLVGLGTAAYSTSGVALVSERIDLRGAEPDWTRVDSIVGDVRIRVTPTDPAAAVFVGITSASAADRYLAGAPVTTVGRLGGGTGVGHPVGSAVPADPQSSGIWSVSASGTGTQTVLWPAADGEWAVVVMNPDASPGVAVRAEVAAEFGALPWVAGTLLAVGLVLLVAAAFLIVLPVRRVARASR